MSTETTETIADLVQVGKDEAVAICAPDGFKPLRYRDLRALVERTVKELNSFGVGRGDRVAMVLPNGPEAATAFVAIAAGATTAPLSPMYRAEEYEFYLKDLRAKVLVVEAGTDSPSRAVAQKLGVPVVDLQLQRDQGAGSFSLKPPGDLRGAASSPGTASAEDEALVLHTSGSTARPKIVPLLQRNVVASSRNISTVLQLVPDDVCLNIMPLFHIHGLMAAVLSSLRVGAQVCCTPGFNALRFFHWFDEVHPTWYTAVPTMHQAILSRAMRHPDFIAKSRLRLIRSSSASLPPAVMQELEKTFRAPVIEAYGMTEAAHQMTSNPLPPKPRKPGTVGVAAGPEVAIMGEEGNVLRRGETGEVVIRGANVTSGYENNPAANEAAFIDDWFRTGDQGEIDSEGYLKLTGRLKELINRGGEKVGPLEIDAILMEHPAVQQVCAFAMPHDKLGEEIAAAVVLREGKSATERELQQFAEKHLAHFKIPRKFVFLKEIPKGPTGKLQRIGLAKKLGLG
ncbi:MAG TPA: acyl--CoA ligase [Myxococcales bacterium]|nr:acyl--CoA ligase [Myxococcales bacterium]